MLGDDCVISPIFLLLQAIVAAILYQKQSHLFLAAKWLNFDVR